MPSTPDFDQESKDALKYDGLPPLEPKKSHSGIVIFTNISSIYLRHGGNIRQVYASTSAVGAGVMVAENGKIICVGATGSPCPEEHYTSGTQRINLEGGSIS